MFNRPNISSYAELLQLSIRTPFRPAMQWLESQCDTYGTIFNNDILPDHAAGKKLIDHIDQNWDKNQHGLNLIKHYIQRQIALESQNALTPSKR